MKDGSVLVEHLKECHDGDTSHPHCHKFKKDVTEWHNTTLDRMVSKAVSIDINQKQDTRRALNRKHGFRDKSVLKSSSSLNKSVLQPDDRQLCPGAWCAQRQLKSSQLEVL